MSDFDPAEMIERFKERASSVRRRQIPPVEGEARREFIRQAELDFRDFAMLGDATAELADGVLTITVDLRPAEDR
jgi:HSP20 family molecular chaperone IbpA